jgi:molybdate/tungstate transport system substrate-binding protein
MSPRFPIPDSRTVLCALALLALANPAASQELVVFNADALGPSLRAAADSFAAREHITIAQENAGSLETARKLTELGKIPDVVALADYAVFPALLMPKYATWYALFARNRMVIAYTSKSKFAAEITAKNWTSILLRPGVETGRADPDRDPNGYRTLLLLQLAEGLYGEPGVAARLLAASPRRNIRPHAADLVALLQAGEFDYVWSYESVAQAAALSYLTLPAEIDLGDPADSTRYATASVRVAGNTPHDSVTFRGAPIAFALSIPVGAPHAVLAARFVTYLFSPDGQRVLRAARLDVLPRPAITGVGAPDAVARTVSP